jgi:hypothetical protein
MTQQEIKALASEIIGDGNTPNKFFVTTSPYFYEIDEFGGGQHKLLDGYDSDETLTYVYDTLEEAEDMYDELELDIYEGIGSVVIEDRLSGQIKEKSLQAIVTVEYSMIENDDTKYFGYKK